MRRGERGRALCAWMGHGPSTQHRCRSPTAPPGRRCWSRGARGSRVADDGGRRVAASGLSSSGRTRTVGLSVSVDSVISIIRHTVARTRTRASFTRFGHRGGRIWPKPAAARRAAGSTAAISPLRRRGERSPGRRAADPAHVRTAAAPHGDEPTENETSENGRTVAARDRRSRRSALAARSHRHEPDVGRAARHATDASCERAA